MNEEADLKTVFEDYAVKNLWNNEESKSGPGNSYLHSKPTEPA